MNVGIIGAGLIGSKRASYLPDGIKLLSVCDIDYPKAKLLADSYSCQATSDWKSVVVNPHLEALIISTPNQYLSIIASEAIRNGKHVLIEKPGARNIEDFQNIIKAYSKNPVVVMIGYNHRYHPSIQKAKQIINSGNYGGILFLRARYGHGGRLGYEKEWRFNPETAGGGELLDQGSHLIDLVNFFAGEMNHTIGYCTNLYWKSILEDSSFVILKNDNNQIAHLCSTAIEWKNIFVFEIMLQKAKIQINGLGRSYGRETLTLYKMKKEMGAPDKQEFDFDQEDKSWYLENLEFFHRIDKKDYSNEHILAAQYILKIIDKIYRRNRRFYL